MTATFHPDTASRERLAEWLLNDAERVAIREWAYLWLTQGCGLPELREMARSAMPEKVIMCPRCSDEVAPSAMLYDPISGEPDTCRECDAEATP
jgi:hypothetical protein